MPRMIPKPRFLHRYRWYYQIAQAAVCVAAVVGSWLLAGGATTAPAAFDQIRQAERPAQAAALTFFGLVLLAFLVEGEARSTERDHANAWAYDALPTMDPIPDDHDHDRPTAGQGDPDCRVCKTLNEVESQL